MENSCTTSDPQRALIPSVQGLWGGASFALSTVLFMVVTTLTCLGSVHSPPETTRVHLRSIHVASEVM